MSANTGFLPTVSGAYGYALKRNNKQQQDSHRFHWPLHRNLRTLAIYIRFAPLVHVVVHLLSHVTKTCSLCMTAFGRFLSIVRDGIRPRRAS